MFRYFFGSSITHVARLLSILIFCISTKTNASECLVDKNNIEKIDRLNREIRILEMRNLAELLAPASEFSVDSGKRDELVAACKSAIDKTIPDSEIGKRKSDLTSEIVSILHKCE